MYTDAAAAHLDSLIEFARDHPDLSGDFRVEDALDVVVGQVLSGPSGPGSTLVAAEQALSAVDTYLFVAVTGLSAQVPGPTLAAAENLKDHAKQAVADMFAVATGSP